MNYPRTASFVFLLFTTVLAVPAAADPWVDTGFIAATPPPDVDLVIVREKAYGAEGVDLSPFGLGGVRDYVQSIYVRLYTDGIGETVDAAKGILSFDEGISILGIITDGDLLGGSTDDGQWTASDLVFGIGSDPDAYSDLDRGFEDGGGVGTSEFVGLTGERRISYGLNVTQGVDDFRIIIDYGDSFPDSLGLTWVGVDWEQLGGAQPATGVHVGTEDPTVWGSGDYGEVLSVKDIPLTGNLVPMTLDPPGYRPLNVIYTSRGDAGTGTLDGYETALDLPMPGLFELPPDFGIPICATDVSLGSLLLLSQDGHLVSTDPYSFQSWTVMLDDLPGSYVDATGPPSIASLFAVRDTPSTTAVDVIDAATGAIITSFDVPGPDTPVGITDGADGLLYILGEAGTMGISDPTGTTQDQVWLAPPTGIYVDLTGVPGDDRIYLLRDTDGDTFIDVFSTSQQTTTHGFATLTQPTFPAGISDGPDGTLHVLGVGASGPAAYVRLDAMTGAILLEHQFMNFPGPNRSLTNLAALPAAVDETWAGVSAFRHVAWPNPFRERVSIGFELPNPTQVDVAIYDARGRRVRGLRRGEGAAGWNTLSWEGRDDRGRVVPSGVYFYRVVAGDEVVGGKIQRR